MSPHAVALRHDRYRAETAPQAGAALLSFSVDGRSALRPAASPEDAARAPRAAACFACVPWFGRIFGGLVAGGRRIRLAPTLPACDPVNALHGEGWTSPWAIAARAPDRLLCRLARDGAAPGRFPFPYEATQAIALDAEGLSVILALRNTGGAPMPAGLGLHPYFPRRRETRLSFAARRLWTPHEGGGGAETPIPRDLDFARPAPLPESDVDHSFAGFSGEAVVETDGLVLRLRSDAPILHLYAPAGADFFCLEPVSHRPGDFGRDMLEPGAQMRLSLRLSPAPAR
ncbi:MAG: aldose 1-epimerase [Amphiplicatus sp.]